MPKTYAIESEAAGSRILRAIARRFATRQEPALRRRETYYDTFEWRLFRAGETFTASERDGGRLIRWTVTAGEDLHVARTVNTPAFAWDLPSGDFRSALGRRIEVRRLLPVVEVDAEVRALRVLDAAEKTIGRFVAERGTAASPDAARRSGKLPRVLRFVPVRGYDEAATEVERFLESELLLRPLDSSELERALAAIGRRPADVPAKFEIALDPRITAFDAARQIQLALLQMALLNEPGLREDLDVEFLHDFRVAIRRTRSALGQIESVFPDDRVRHFRGEFTWLGRLTSPARDTDVYLMRLPEYEEWIAEEERTHLAPFRRYLEERKRRERSELLASLASPRYHELVRGWRELLEDPRSATPAPPNALRPAVEVASARIRRRFRSVLAIGRKIDEAAPPDALHRLRIECKKLRYLLEFFSSLFAAAEIASLVKGLKFLQDNLGEFNDLRIQQATIRRFAEEAADRDEGPASLLAVGQILGRLAARQVEERRRFDECFNLFASAKNERLFRSLFLSPAGDAPCA